MKKFILFILLFATFSCDKDEPKPFSEQHSEQEVFNAIIGTWCPNRLAYDEDFKQIENTENYPNWKKNNVIFNANNTTSTFVEWLDEDFQGSFYIEKEQQLNGRIDINIKYEGIVIYLSPTIGRVKGATIHNYTDSTLIFSEVSHIKDGKSIPNLYSEFKRVK